MFGKLKFSKTTPITDQWLTLFKNAKPLIDRCRPHVGSTKLNLQRA